MVNIFKPKPLLYINFVLSLLLAILIGLFTRTFIYSNAEEVFNDELDSLENEFQSSMDKYTSLVLNLQAFTAGSMEVTRLEWDRYMDLIDIDSNYRGLFLSYMAERIHISEKDDLEQEIKNDTSLNGVGYPNARIKPVRADVQHGEMLAVIKYIYPMDPANETSLGVDLLTEETRAETIIKAIETRKPAASDPFITGINNEEIFGVGVPVVEPGTGEIRELVGIAFDVDTFFETHVSNVSLDSLIGLNVYDLDMETGEKDLLYTRNINENVRNYSGSFNIEFTDHSWEFNVTVPRDALLSSSDRIIPWLVTALFFLIFMAVNFLIYNLRVSQLKAVSIAGEYSKNLSQSKNLLRSLMNNFPGVVSVKDTKDKIMMVNDEFETLTRFDEDQIIGKEQSKFYPFSDYAKVKSEDEKVVKNKSLVVFDEILKLQDADKVYSTLKFPLIDEDGDVYAIASISSDITEKQNFEQVLKERTSQVEKLNQLMVGREIKMNELKSELEEKAKKLESTETEVDLN